MSIKGKLMPRKNRHEWHVLCVTVIMPPRKNGRSLVCHHLGMYALQARGKSVAYLRTIVLTPGCRLGPDLHPPYEGKGKKERLFQGLWTAAVPIHSFL